MAQSSMGGGRPGIGRKIAACLSRPTNDHASGIEAGHGQSWEEAMRQPIDARVIPEIREADYAAFHGMIKLLPPSYDRWWLYHDTALRKRGGSGRDDRPIQMPLAEPGAGHIG